MMKLPFIFLCILLLSAERIVAQQLTPFVVSTSGGFYSNSSGTLSFTTGEMTAVETFTTPSAILTQGFQQPWDFGTSVIEHPDVTFSFGIHPNPTDGLFKLVTESPLTRHVSVSVMDMLGRELQQSQFIHLDNIHVEYFDLSHASQGIYLIALTVTENNSSKPTNQFIQKIHVVR